MILKLICPVFSVLLIRLTIRLTDFHSFGTFSNFCKYHFLPFFPTKRPGKHCVLTCSEGECSVQK